jgi:hypothetical protein
MRFDLIDALKTRLDEIARAHLAGKVQFAGPVSDYFLKAGAPALDESEPKEEPTPAEVETDLRAVIADLDSLAVLYFDAAQTFQHDATPIFTTKAEALRRLAGEGVAGTERAGQVAAEFAGRVGRIAQGIHTGLEKIEPGGEQAMRVAEGLIPILRSVSTELLREEARAARRVAEAASAFRGALSDIIEVSPDLRGYSETLDRAIDGLLNAIDRSYMHYSSMEASADRVSRLADELGSF